jgi:hypothetical protein
MDDVASSGLKEEGDDFQVRPKVTFCQALNHNGFALTRPLVFFWSVDLARYYWG